VGDRRRQSPPDRLDNAVQVVVNLGVPEPQRYKTLSLEDGVPHGVMPNVVDLGMLSAV
jgi:hypothetical protein